MNRKRYLLDASAILTLVEDESGAERVEQIIRQAEDVYIPWVALMEVYYITQQERDQPEADRRYALIKHLLADVLWEMDEPTLLTAARLKATHSLSFADSIVAAYGMQLNATLIHKDPEFEALAEQLILETLPYKL